MRGRMRNCIVALVGSLCVLCSTPQSKAASGPEIDASVRATLDQFFHEIWSSRDLANKAAAILIFPTVVKAGFGIGGEYGEGGFVYQDLAPLRSFDGKYPVIGSWVIGQPPGGRAPSHVAAGIGIRESDMPITTNLSQFVPHLIE